VLELGLTVTSHLGLSNVTIVQKVYYDLALVTMPFIMRRD